MGAVVVDQVDEGASGKAYRADAKPRSAFIVALLAIVLLIPPVLLATMAVPRLGAGLAQAKIEDVISDRRLGYEILPARSEIAERSLSRALPADGDSEIWRAELIAVRGSHDKAELRTAQALVVDGLSHAPASTRGWTLLCEIDFSIVRADAPACMNTAFYVGPFDWYVAQRRTVLSAVLFPKLDADTRAAAARRLKLVWEDPGLRWVAYEAANQPNGAALVSAAFADDPVGMKNFEAGLTAARAQTDRTAS